MNCKFINVLMFAVGAAVGSAVTWKVVKTKYERIAREEIESVKETFADRFGLSQEQEDDSTEPEDEDDVWPDGVTHIDWTDLEDLDEEDDEEYEPTDEDLEEYASLVDRYTNSDQKGGAEMTKDVAREPYVISPYDYGEIDGYRTFELTYYADDILEDEDYNIVKDVDELLGPKALTTFGEYEDDSVFVRNEQLRSDFQILRDPRTYDQARSIGPAQVDDE